jgi:hypothetical protein
LPSLDGSRSKLARAKGQIEGLRGELQDFMKEHELTLALKNDTYDGDAAVTLYVTNAPTFPLEFGVAIGEIAHNLRSALDHLAWSLVPAAARHQLSAADRRAIAFPMAVRRRGRGGFWEGAKRGEPGIIDRQLPGTSQAIRATLENYQPYRRSPDGRATRTLRTLSNTDKHRVLVPAVFYPVDFHYDMKFKGARQGSRHVRLPRGRSLRTGDELLTWTFSRKPREMKVDLQVKSVPGFRPSHVSPAPGNDFEEATGTLTTIHTVCTRVLDDIAQSK